jgi:hypothetical protein
MQRVYQAANNVEAHMVVHMLDQAGVQAHVQGEHLQSGAGELPLGNLVAVAVADEDVPKAREIIRDWEATIVTPEPGAAAPAKSSATSYTVAFTVGALLAGGVVWAMFNGPEQANELDRNGDGKIDDRYFVSGDRIERVETDRDFDGRVDAVLQYARSGDLREYRSDDDFDGRFDSMVTYRDGQPQRFEQDLDGDGRIDLRTLYEHGVARTTEYLDRDSRHVVKTVSFRGGKALHADLDLDGDGRFERSYDFDAIDEPVGR